MWDESTYPFQNLDVAVVHMKQLIFKYQVMVHSGLWKNKQLFRAGL